ncbi:MAG: FMN-binding glutamate synthase family protein, partial [Acidobacteria bacterium]|nr:FMN-binding glutamate synthase family protein [Candidatus Polarisedimenticola svalbardensis]
MNIRRLFLVSSIIVLLAVIGLAWLNRSVLWSLVVIGPVILLGLHDLLQTRHSLLRNFPLLGHGRYFMEAFRPEIYQYFVESNTNGKPFSRQFRSIAYQRAKGELGTHPFGTEFDVYQVGYEWMPHSLEARHLDLENPRVKVGGPSCSQPYMASILNISAMSYGSLSSNAILALNQGAAAGQFAHNTGEGGLSPHHEHHGGDLIWQIGTGYFGCRNQDGTFDMEAFADKASRPHVKMVEVKLSQGAKP